MDITELLKLMVKERASDLHLRVPSPPVLRVDGELLVQEKSPPLTTEDTEAAFDVGM